MKGKKRIIDDDCKRWELEEVRRIYKVKNK